MIKALFMGLGLGLVLVACSSFTYKYYAWDYQSGVLLGHTAAEDLPQTTCQGDSTSKIKCIVVPLDEFYRMKGDFEKTQSDLKACQSH